MGYVTGNSRFDTTEICTDSIEEYERARTRFELIAVANKWEN